MLIIPHTLNHEEERKGERLQKKRSRENDYLTDEPCTYVRAYKREPYIYLIDHAIATCMQTISYRAAQIQQDNGH